MEDAWIRSAAVTTEPARNPPNGGEVDGNEKAGHSSLQLVRIIRNYQIRNSGQEIPINDWISAYVPIYCIRLS